jgi:ATP-dependent DNA ligase
MLAQVVDEIPEGDWLYEPKWDGFRALLFRDGPELELHSRSQRPLGRYFPELLSALPARLPRRVVLDGEIVIAGARGLDFDALLLRLHPAASRVERLAHESPASFVAFDVLAHGARDLRGWPLRRRRAELERLLRDAEPPLLLSPASTDAAAARRWFERFEGAGLDGVIAKPLDGAYRPGERVMAKIKHRRSADCVVAGYRAGEDGQPVSLLLGLYDGERRLHFAGVATGFSRTRRGELAAALRGLRRGARAGHPWLAPGADDRQRIPGGPSRWSGSRSLDWEPLRPERVVEVAYDHLQGDRFRHATRFLRWRPDRTPESCTYAQLEVAPPAELRALFARRAASRARSAG